MRALFSALLRRPVMRVAIALFAVAPLLAISGLARQPGYELATALGLLLTLAGNLPALALVQVLRNPSPGPSPSGEGNAVLTDLPPPRSGRGQGEGFLLALLLNLLLCLPTLLISLLASALLTPCNPFAGLPFCLLLVPSCAALSAATGLLFALIFEEGPKAELAYLLTALASALVTAWPLLTGPQVFAYNLFVGYFPGPIYDEALQVTSPLLWSRVEAAAWTIAAVALARLGTEPGTWAWKRLRRDRGALTALVLSLLAVLGLRLNAGELGLRTTDADVQKVLAGLRETPHFRIHYPAERPRPEIERLARDLEFRYQQDAAFLGLTEPQQVDAYYYRSAEEKQRWVGAAETDFAKPWLHQFHLQLEGFPDRTAKHELAHVLAGVLGVRPFGIAGGSLLPNAGLIEGLATAADNEVDELTLDQWSAAMRKLGLAPDVNSLFSAEGFWSQEQGRAYTVAGSFLRWIARTKGTKALQELYRTGDFEHSAGAPLAALAAEWGAALDQVPLDERALHVARRRFSAPSLFSQACARETARLRQQAGEVAQAEPDQAKAIEERLEHLEPGNPDPLFAEAQILDGAHRLPEARAALLKVLDLPGLGEAPQAGAELGLAVFSLRAHDDAEAKLRLSKVIALQPDRSTARQAELRLQALGDPLATETVDGYLRRPGREESLLSLKELADARPALGAPRYLLSRRLTDLNLPDRAAPYLRDLPLADAPTLPEVTQEWLRLRIRSEAQRLECEAIPADEATLLTLEGGAQTATGYADQRWVADWKERCQFERETFHTPVEAE